MTEDLFAAIYDDMSGIMEMSLSNWGPTAGGSPGYKYSEGDQLLPGIRIALYVDCGPVRTKLAEGKITALAFRFSESSAPTVAVTARAEPGGPANPSPLNLTYGRDLLSFHAVLKAGMIEFTGSSRDLPGLQKGAAIRVSGAGLRFDGIYPIAGTVHSWDAAKGYQVQFRGKKSPGGAPAGRR